MAVHNGISAGCQPHKRGVPSRRQQRPTRPHASTPQGRDKGAAQYDACIVTATKKEGPSRPALGTAPFKTHTYLHCAHGRRVRARRRARGATLHVNQGCCAASRRRYNRSRGESDGEDDGVRVHRVVCVRVSRRDPYNSVEGEQGVCVAQCVLPSPALCTCVFAS